MSKQYARPDLRKYGDKTYVAHLWSLPNGTRFRHCAEGAYAIKVCDAYQRTSTGKEVIYARNDLVEVFK